MNVLAINRGSSSLKFKVVAFVECHVLIQENPAGQGTRTERFVNRWIASNDPDQEQNPGNLAATGATLARFKAPAIEHRRLVLDDN